MQIVLKRQSQVSYGNEISNIKFCRAETRRIEMGRIGSLEHNKVERHTGH